MPKLYNILVMIALFYTMFTGLFLKAMEILTELKINITAITTYFTVNIVKLILFRIKFLEKEINIAAIDQGLHIYY